MQLDDEHDALNSGHIQHNDLAYYHIMQLDATYENQSDKNKMTTCPSYPARLGPRGHISNVQAQVPIDFDHLRSQGW